MSEVVDVAFFGVHSEVPAVASEALPRHICGGTDTSLELSVAALGVTLASASKKGVSSGPPRFHPKTNLRSE